MGQPEPLVFLMRRLLPAAMILAFGPVLWGQTTSRSGIGGPPVNVTGRVVEDESGAPIPNARVSTAAKGVGVPVVLAGEDGRFSLTLPSGAHLIAASKTGYRGKKSWRREATPSRFAFRKALRSRAA